MAGVIADILNTAGNMSVAVRRARLEFGNPTSITCSETAGILLAPPPP